MSSTKPLAGHWLLAQAGKKVLRPGGLETTHWLLNHLPLHGNRVVEFAPGLGVTAKDILAHAPATYTGIDADPNAVETTLNALAHTDTEVKVIHGSAEATTLPDASADVVVGEAMLTMNTDKHKLDIMREAARILAPGGHYGIHELGLTPDELDESTKTEIQRSLAQAIKVNARPLTTAEWSALAEEAGFKIVGIYHTPMSLLEPRRMIADEGLARTIKIVFNIIRQPELRSRVRTMRATFRRYADHMNAVGLVLEKV